MAARLPLHELHLTAGAVVTASDGWEVPDSYGDPAAEYAAVREGTGLLDRGDLSAFAVTGRDRAAFLHAMLSNDVKSIRPGQGCRAALLDIQGKVQVTLLLLATDEEILALAPPGCAASTVETLDRYLFSEKVSFRDVTGEIAPLVLAGPSAPAAAQQLAGTLPGEARWSHGAASIDGAEVRLVRGGVDTGGPEIWMLASPDVASRLWQAARNAGARPVGRAAQEALRIEAGTPRFGADVDASVLLPEIPSADLVSATKGCYIGQEVVVRIRDRGHVNRHLRGLLVDGTAVPAPGARVLVEDVEVGKVTSSAWSYARGRPVALAFLRRQHAEPGTPVSVSEGEDRCAAHVSDLPFPP